ncbi:MAG: TIM barrel protein [Oscillospiraceae bacterium]|nr:TIM barrel protein [Oscillospiraceae bacterium]
MDQWYLSTIDGTAQNVAKKYGLGLEIAEYCTAWNMDERFSETDAAVRQKIQGISRLVFHAPFNELFPCAIDPKARALAAERYRQAIALAQGYGASKIIIHGGYNPRLYYPVWYTEQSVLFWRDFLKDDPGLEIVLENVFEEEPEMLLEIVRGVDDPRLRLCLDVGHVNAYSELPAQLWLERCAPWLSHFHIHNNDGSWDTHSQLFEGTIHMSAVLQSIDALCPGATVTLELTDPEPSVIWLKEQVWNR